MRWDEPVGMLTSIALFLIILCAALLNGAAEWVFRNFRIICWVILLVFLGIAWLQIRKGLNQGIKPVLVTVCLLISQVTYAFFIMLTVRDLSLVGKEGIMGLIGFAVLVPFYAVGLGICRGPNMLSCSVGDEPELYILDAFATPGLIALACWIFGFYDSLPVVWHALFGG